jgi:glycosyltransferase involved in cell wall biosynthesis
MKQKISLIICAYNEEKYIASCLEHAIKNSQGKFYEIIVVDNASTDRTGDIAGAFPGVKVVREERKGMVRARQRGLMEARGDILAFIDADTRLPAGWYEKVAREFTRNLKLACLSGPYIYYDIPKWQRFIVWIYWYFLGMPVYLLVGYMVTGANFAIRRSVLEKMNGFDTNIEFYGEDTDIARRASKFGKVKFSPLLAMPTSGRRLSGQGLWKTGWLYITNFASQVIRHKPTTGEYKDIR